MTTNVLPLHFAPSSSQNSNIDNFYPDCHNDFKNLLKSLELYCQKTNILFLIQYKDVIFSCVYFSSSSGNLDHVNSILNSDTNGFASFKTSGITLANLLSNSDNVNGFGDIGSSRNVAWSNGTDSHDSGIGHSPPFDNGLRYICFEISRILQRNFKRRTSKTRNFTVVILLCFGLI